MTFSAMKMLEYTRTCVAGLFMRAAAHLHRDRQADSRGGSREADSKAREPLFLRYYASHYIQPDRSQSRAPAKRQARVFRAR
jgi:hypothetical protein